MNQFKYHLHDGLATEECITQDINPKGNTVNDCNCLTHGLCNQFKQINNYLKDRLEANECIQYRGGLIKGLEVLSRVFSMHQEYCHSKSLNVVAYCKDNNIPYIFRELKQYPETRLFHLLRHIDILVESIPILNGWMNSRGVALMKISCKILLLILSRITKQMLN
eukprot:110597_1